MDNRTPRIRLDDIKTHAWRNAQTKTPHISTLRYSAVKETNLELQNENARNDI